MLRVEIRFPLGVYYALSSASFGRPEWPPSPVRLVGALLAAAHETPSADTDASRTVLQRLCAASAPTVFAPEMVDVGDDAPRDEARPGIDPVIGFRGPSRWAPRNHSDSEVKASGLSTRNLARDRAEVHKGGVAIGDQTIEIRWNDLELTAADLAALRALADEVTFLGTSRSPAIVSVSSDAPAETREDAWEPAEAGSRGDTGIRVPDAGLLRAFDQRHEARKSTPKRPVAPADQIPSTPMGRTTPYRRRAHWLAQIAGTPIDPRLWGDMIVVELDPGSPGAGGKTSQMRPKASAAFLIARAFRQALLGNFDAVGTPGEAPPILRGRNDQPHAAFVPLPFVGTITTKGKRADGADDIRRVAADGGIRGIAVLLPHEDLVPDVAEQRLRVESGLLRMLADPTFAVPTPSDLPSAVQDRRNRLLAIRLPNPNRPLLQTLREERYRTASRVWDTVVPIVHARRRTSTGPRGVYRQVAADCVFAGLPEPARVEILTEAPFGGAPSYLLPDRMIPADWIGPLQGPRSHVRITFDRPVVGPLLLGKARHFGVGLCLPNRELDRKLARDAGILEPNEPAETTEAVVA